MGLLLTLLYGGALGGLALWDQHAGHPGLPGWSLALLGLLFSLMLVLSVVFDR